MKTKLDKYLNEKTETKEDIEKWLNKLNNRVKDVEIDEYSDQMNIVVKMKTYIDNEDLKKLSSKFTIENISFNDSAIELSYNK